MKTQPRSFPVTAGARLSLTKVSGSSLRNLTTKGTKAHEGEPLK